MRTRKWLQDLVALIPGVGSLTRKVPCSVSADTFESGRMARSVEILGVGIGEKIRGRSESTLLGRVSQCTALCTYGRADVSRELCGMSAFFAVGHCNDTMRT